MSDLHSTERVHAPLGKRGALEGVARRHGRRRNPARTPPRSSLRPSSQRPLYSSQRWVEKRERSIKGSETPHKHATFRWACNKRLRNALGTLAHSTRIWNPWAADRYAHARARGHNHRRALRTLGRAWSRIIWRCWQNRIPYDPQRHTGLQQHITVTIPTASGPRPDLTATQRMAGAAVTPTAARRGERAALDGKPPIATHARG